MLYFQITFYILAIFCLFTPVSYADQTFDTWLSDFKKEAISKGISEKILNEAMFSIKPIPRIIELDRKQPEENLTFAQYKKRIISQARVEQGRKLYNKHKNKLNRISKKYGVPSNIIIALWGIETSYGNNTGGFDVISALATLAYDGRRSSFFRKELLEAMQILEEGHIAPSDMKGSWAGAMGQNQFMPSSFHAYAVDNDGDGKRDIWTSLPDIFASTANYLQKNGWNSNERWGRLVRLPKNFPKSLTGRDVSKTLQQWQRMGVLLPNGKDIPVINGMKASIILPDTIAGTAFLVYDNYNVIMKWNRSIYFATSVGLLADKIAQ
ncbi:MAG: lytic murein transglycosylase [Alphaproteobacteria bacterium]|nr:lytic murein transglycosylase [Alphaproteobacteria bacterium]